MKFLECGQQLFVFHGQADRTMAARAVAIVDPTWCLTQQGTPRTQDFPPTENAASSSAAPTTVINLQQTFNGQQMMSSTQRTVATQTELLINP